MELEEVGVVDCIAHRHVVDPTDVDEVENIVGAVLGEI